MDQDHERLTILPPEEVVLRLKSGRDVKVTKYHHFLNSNEISAKARETPVLIKLPVVVETDRGNYESRKPIWILFAHGYRSGDHHLLMPDGIASEEVVPMLAEQMWDEDPGERLKLFIACDEQRAPLRWDEGKVGRQTGVVGISGGINSVRTELQQHLIVDAKGLRNVFTDSDHPNRFMINPPAFVFRPPGNKIVIES